jgi:threonine dehydratase
VLDDVPGSLNELTGIVAKHRANILDVSHKRLAEELPLGKTLVAFTIEARSRDCLNDLLLSIKAGGFRVWGKDR